MSPPTTAPGAEPVVVGVDFGSFSGRAVVVRIGDGAEHHAALGQSDRLNELARKRSEALLERCGGLISSEWEFAKARSGAGTRRTHRLALGL